MAISPVEPRQSAAKTHIARLPTPPHMPAVARILSRFDRDHLEAFLTVAIELLDTLDGDDDDEPDADSEDSDPIETAWFEDLSAQNLSEADWGQRWNACVRGEDDEDDDADSCIAGDDLARGGPAFPLRWWNREVRKGRQPGDDDDFEHDGREIDDDGY